MKSCFFAAQSDSSEGESVRKTELSLACSMEPLLDKLPFKLTDAEVFSEIERHRSSARMNRLVQGMGSGKTIVAVMALYKAVKNGFQGAFMAPTRSLQNSIIKVWSPILVDVSVRLLTGSMKREKE